MKEEETEDWPECTKEGCGNEVNPKRWALGYRTCLKCGSPLKQFTVAPAYNKGGLQLISPDMLEHIGRK